MNIRSVFVVMVLLAALAAPLAGAREAQGLPKVPDAAAPVIELDLPAGDRLRPTLAWISDQDLLATTLINPSSKFWENRVVRVEVKTRQISEVIPQGLLLCANASAGRAGMLVGSLAKSFAGDSKEPEPVETLFEWSRPQRKLLPAAAESDFSPWICRQVRAEHRKGPMQGRNVDITYLEQRHGVLRLLPDAREYRSVHLEHNGKRMPVNLRYKELLDTPEYLAFRDAYLIATGSTLAEAFYRDEQGEAQQESPIITMTPSGEVRREHPRGSLLRLGLKVDALVRPYAKGMLVISHGRRDSGGGIYTLAGTQLRRVWCIPSGNSPDRQCRVAEHALSPDGCMLAFYAKESDTPGAAQFSSSANLKILDLCAPPAKP